MVCIKYIFMIFRVNAPIDSLLEKKFIEKARLVSGKLMVKNTKYTAKISVF